MTFAGSAQAPGSSRASRSSKREPRWTSSDGALPTPIPTRTKAGALPLTGSTDVVIGRGLRTAVTVLFAATLFVLLIGCANLANLALARSLSREGEMAVRAALGANRWQLIRQLLIEHVVIAVCGGVVGAGVGYAMLKWIQSLIPLDSLPPAMDVRMDTSVLLFTLTVAVATGLLSGVAPGSADYEAGPVRRPEGRRTRHDHRQPGPAHARRSRRRRNRARFRPGSLLRDC